MEKRKENDADPMSLMPTPERRSSPVSEILQEIEQIEARQSGFRLKVIGTLLKSLWRRDPDALREIAPEIAALLERRLLERANRITRWWCIFDPGVRAALEAEAATIAGSAPVELRHRRVAKRQAIQVALWEVEHDPQLQLEVVMCQAFLPDSQPEAKLAIRLAETQLLSGSLLVRRSRKQGRAREVPLLESLVDLDDPEAILLAQEDEAWREQMLDLACEMVVGVLTEAETDALMAVLHEIPLAEWARKTGRAPSTARSLWARAQAKLERAGTAAHVMRVAV